MILSFATLAEAEDVADPKYILADINKYVVFTGTDIPVIINNENINEEIVVQSTNDLALFDNSYGSAISHEGDLSGNFYWSSSGTPNGGTVFPGKSGFWNRHVLYGMHNAVWYGADPTGVKDSTQAFVNALAATSHVICPAGNYRCDSMLSVLGGKVLQLNSGAFLIRKSANSTSTDPVVWVKGTSGGLVGAGQGASGVTTENRSPNGCVLVGHWDMTASHGHVNYNTIRDIAIRGSIPYGQTTGEPDVGLMITNPQFNNFTVYFQSISSIKFMDFNIGIWLRAWANANTISHIQGYRIGNVTLGLNKNAFIYNQGALDNAMSLAFFHSSPGSIGLLVDEIDNTANGGILHEPYANTFSGLVFEQGGSGAIGLKAIKSVGSYYQIRNNVSGGNVVFDGFEDTNFLLGNTGNTPFLAKAGRQKLRYYDDAEGVDRAVEKYVTYTALLEDATYEVAAFGINSSASNLVEIDFASSDVHSLGYNGSGKVIFSISRSTAGVYAVTTLTSRYTGGIKPCEVIVDVSDICHILFRVNNNAGALTFSLHAQIKITTSSSGGLLPSIIKDAAVLYATAGTPLLNNI